MCLLLLVGVRLRDQWIILDDPFVFEFFSGDF